MNLDFRAFPLALIGPSAILYRLGRYRIGAYLLILFLQGCSGEFISLSGDLPAHTTLTFRTHPQDQSVTEEQTVVFEALAKGIPEPSYNWEEWMEREGQWQSITSATGPKLEIDVQPGDPKERTFRCVASNTKMRIYSERAQLIFIEQPKEDVPRNTSAPYLSGSAEIGSTLTVHPGTWDSRSDLRFHYEWYVDSVLRLSTDSASFTPSVQDEGHELKAKVIATGSGGTSYAWTASIGPVYFPLYSKLFGNAEKGLYLPSMDPLNMYRDLLAQELVDTPGQTVALVVDPSEDLPLSQEKVSNADFALGTGWSMGGGWSISGGQLHAGTDGSLASQNIGLLPNRAYLVTMNVSGRTQGHLGVQLGGYAHEGHRYIFSGSNGLHQGIYVTRPTASSMLHLQVNNNWNGKIDDISIKEVPYNRLFQTTASKRPTFGREPRTGRRNLLTYTEDFAHANWNKTHVNLVADQLAPDQSLTAVKLEATSVHATHQIIQMATVTDDVYSFSVYAKAAGEPTMALFTSNLSIGHFFNLSTGTLLGPVGAPAGATIEPAGDGWYRCTVKIHASAASFSWRIYVRTTQVYAGNNQDGILIWRPQLEKAPNASAYQRVGSSFDVTESGVPHLNYLWFDGVNDSLHSALPADFNLQEMSIWSGIQKHTDAQEAIAFELGQPTTDQRLSIYAPDSAGGYKMSYRDSSSNEIDIDASGPQWAAPQKAVLHGLFDILASRLTLRINEATTEETSGTTLDSQFQDTSLHIGQRVDATAPFSGKLYSLIYRNKNTAQSTSNIIQQLLMKSIGIE
jgi:hypothetical protein